MVRGDVVVLRTTGRKSGKEREVPLISVEDDLGWIMTASYSGHDAHPGWYHNLMANPIASLLIDDAATAVTATQLEGTERQVAWDSMVDVYPDYGAYQLVTDRQIPVLRLTTRKGPSM